MMPAVPGRSRDELYLENPMRKGALLLALAFAVGLTTSASAAKKMADPAVQAQKDSMAFWNDAFHPWAPSATMSKPKGKAKKK
jgi:hypothetical protein